jgi:glycosyltransferase involved in cell wall biosynthesis
MENDSVKVWLPAIRAGTGADVYTVRLAEGLRRYGMAAEITWFPLRFEAMPFLLRHATPPAGTDIVFANSWNGCAFKRPGLPLVVTVHHSGFDRATRTVQSLAQRAYHRLVVKPYEMRSLRAADVITSVSRFAADSVQRATGIDGVRVIHNWVDTARFFPLPAQREPGGLFRLLFVGKLSQGKGADLLGAIMRRLGPEFELSVAGRLNKRHVFDCPANMHVLGWLAENDLIEAYRQCDAVLFPSRSEGFGYAALEAMACGKPVIASDATALPEVVTNGVTGMLCPVDDVAAFAGACRALAASPERQCRFGTAGRQRALDAFSEAAALPKYMALISELLKR